MLHLIKFFLLFICFFSVASDDVVITEAWVRSVNENIKISNLYLTVTNNSSKTDYLTNVTSSISDDITLHKTVIKNNIAQSVKVSILAIPEKTTLKLEPAAINFVIKNIKSPIKKGQLIEFNLFFDNAGTKKVTAKIK
jgi:copper(I)-binding protein